MYKIKSKMADTQDIFTTFSEQKSIQKYTLDKINSRLEVLLCGHKGLKRNKEVFAEKPGDPTVTSSVVTAEKEAYP